MGSTNLSRKLKDELVGKIQVMMIISIRSFSRHVKDERTCTHGSLAAVSNQFHFLPCNS